MPYPTQKDHVLAWFRAQATQGAGPYTRSTPTTSPKRAYNWLLCSEALIRIAEALGAKTRLVQQAAEAVATEPDHRRRCGLIRAILLWEMIAGLATHSDGWRR